MTTLIVLAKECIPGRVKTRLHPEFSYEEAARIASASIADTLAAVECLPASRRILCFDGGNPPPGTGEYEIVPQVSGDLDERIATVLDRCSGPTVLIGMDTPQISAEHLRPVFDPWPDGVDAWLGAATDGGFWALALAEPSGVLVRGVPMSRTDTGILQRTRLVDAGFSVADLAPLTDVDSAADLHDVVGMIPGSSTADVTRAILATRTAR
jgi:glycosyltransferase A (GT-A) superfamily protein (DUF2064 family)